MCVNMTGVYTSFLKHLYYGMWKKLKSQKFLLLQYLWCYWSKIDNFHFSTVCTMIPNKLSKSFPDRTGHVTYRKFNHVREHLNKWLLQRISLLFLQRIPDIQTIPNKSQVWPRIVRKGAHGSAVELADTWQCLTVVCRLLHPRQTEWYPGEICIFHILLPHLDFPEYYSSRKIQEVASLESHFVFCDADLWKWQPFCYAWEYS